jgi:hypothetical protein
MPDPRTIQQRARRFRRPASCHPDSIRLVVAVLVGTASAGHRMVLGVDHIAPVAVQAGLAGKGSGLHHSNPVHHLGCCCSTVACHREQGQRHSERVLETEGIAEALLGHMVSTCWRFVRRCIEFVE